LPVEEGSSTEVRTTLAGGDDFLAGDDAVAEPEFRR